MSFLTDSLDCAAYYENKSHFLEDLSLSIKFLCLLLWCRSLIYFRVYLVSFMQGIQLKLGIY